jgi:hypothetical protein
MLGDLWDRVLRADGRYFVLMSSGGTPGVRQLWLCVSNNNVALTSSFLEGLVW